VESDVDDLTERYVRPFYLNMMGLNATTSGEDQLEAIRALGRTLDAEVVIQLLRGGWRPRVMGAWFALFHSPSVVGQEVPRSLETSAGGLTAPPLATVASHLMGPVAVSALQVYAATEEASRDGSGQFIAAAIKHLGSAVGGGTVGDEHRARFAAMLAVAERLRVE
jgi:hypothetical protein